MLAVVESRNVDQCPVSATIFRTVGQVCGYFIPTTFSELQGLAKERGAREGKVNVVLTYHNPPTGNSEALSAQLPHEQVQSLR